MKLIIATFIATSSFSGFAFAQDTAVQNLTNIDSLPDIAELPMLDLSGPAVSEFTAVDITADLPAAKTTMPSSSLALDDIPDAQKDLIERLNYKKKEGSKIKRYKPEFGIKATNVEVGASQKK